MNLTGRAPLGQKAPKPIRDRAHIGRVKQLPCVICRHPPPSDAHHCIHDRNDTRRVGDDETIPLCRDCHMEGPDAIHRGKASWRLRNGPDWGFLPVVRAMLDDTETDF